VSRTNWLVKRLIRALVTTFVIITFNFFLFRVMPGDAVSNLSRIPHATPELKKEIAAQFGLDQSIRHQFLAYLNQLFHGNLGISYQDQQSVVSHLGDAIVHSVPMVLFGTVLSIVLGIASGLWAAWRRGTFQEKLSTSSAMFFYSLPTQFLGMILLLVFAGWLGWFPSGGTGNEFNYLGQTNQAEQLGEGLRAMFLPALTLALILYGQYTLIVRSGLLETLGEDYILTAKAKGLSDRRIMMKHAFRNGMLPVVTLIALSFGFIAAGTILVEDVFSYHGLGLLVADAIRRRDYPLLQGAFLLITVCVIVANLLADLLYFKLDPRITT
jgi:ABC-type dipeptide/oligopeptide/nickel transport system permease component